ncbi:hypothetical protein OIDMADRAFT_105166 [Oidiodendron maius Zn]|uniref:C2H2-type domain-containing protein n=1 Tax=Oidiodendron maius (strain Zn) TaxID=913774 RepID=A0A0C3GRU1_OIDMZ|nr:hypothetical protein OIDMADRAFT_105166 [Oidiodendron maius Zn]
MPYKLPSTPGASHSRDKAFQCVFCQRSFARREHRKRHERIHTKDKPYRCRECPRSFTRSDLLVRHQKLSHADADGDNQNIVYPTGSSGAKRRENTRRRRHEPHQESQAEDCAEQNAVLSGAEYELPFPASQQSLSHLPMPPLLTGNPTGGLLSTVPTIVPDPLQGTPLVYDLSMGSVPTGVIDMDMDFGNFLHDYPSVFGSFGMPPFWYAPNLHIEPVIPRFWPDQILNDPGLFHTEYNQRDPIEYLDGLNGHTESLNALSRFGSRLPSLQLESELTTASRKSTKSHPLWNITAEDRQQLLLNIAGFNSVMPSGFVLPSRHTLSRYLAGYVSGFHGHLPFLHISTIEIKKASPEIILAIVAVGSQYCFEHTKGVELFMASRVIASERIRRNGDLKSGGLYRKEADQVTSGPRPTFNSLETRQTLLLLMAMATWSGNKEMYAEALAIQSILASMIREHGLLNSENTATSATWEDWIRLESIKRTNFMIYCVSNFHSIICNTAPAILNAELSMDLPCSEAEWKLPTADTWEDFHRLSGPNPGFQKSLLYLFTNKGNMSSFKCSSLGGYILIHALIQQIFLVRQTSIYRPGSDGNLSPQEVSVLEQALTNWTRMWEGNPESSLDPKSPHGPVAFTSSALLRIAYIRLHVDIGPWRALETQDPLRIAKAMLYSPAVQRSSKLTQAALHSAHALSIPIRLGINLISRNQILTWSLQHSVCSLEYAFLLSKWLDAVTTQLSNDQALNKDEQLLLDFVTSILIESDSDRPSIINVADGTEEGRRSSSCTTLSARVVKVWARMFSGDGIWGVVNMIGRVMCAYGDMLEGGTS